MNINCVTAPPSVTLRLQRVPHLEGNSLILDILPDLLFPPLSKSLPLGMKDFTVLSRETSAIKTHRREKHPPPILLPVFCRASVIRRIKHVRDPYHHHRLLAFFNINLTKILTVHRQIFFLCFWCFQFNSHVTPAMDSQHLSAQKKKPKPTHPGLRTTKSFVQKEKSNPSLKTDVSEALLDVSEEKEIATAFRRPLGSFHPGQYH